MTIVQESYSINNKAVTLLKAFDDGTEVYSRRVTTHADADDCRVLYFVKEGKLLFIQTITASYSQNSGYVDEITFLPCLSMDLE